MALAVEMPKLGNTVEECLIARWLKQEGQTVSAGETVVEIETDKTSFEVAAPVDGLVLATFFEQGALVPVFTPLFVIGNAGESVEAFRPQLQQSTATAESAVPPASSTLDSNPGHQTASATYSNLPPSWGTPAPGGGFATAVIADARYAFPLGEAGSDVAMAPWLCAGLIGWRSLAIAGQGTKLGIYGFGAAAHIVAQVAKWQGRSVFAFTRTGDAATQAFARRLGAAWAGGSDEMPPEPLDAAIIYAPVGDLVPLALKAVRKGGRVVCAGIHMSDIPRFPYQRLWEERQLVSVANLTRQDGIDFLRLAPEIGIVTETTRYPLNQANQALADLRAGRFEGAAVLAP